MKVEQIWSKDVEKQSHDAKQNILTNLSVPPCLDEGNDHHGGKYRYCYKQNSRASLNQKSDNLGYKLRQLTHLFRFV